MSKLDVGAIERRDEYLERFTQQVVYKTRVPATVAQIAIDMATRWGLVAAAPDGEDSAGRQKARKVSPAELAVEACDTAAALWDQFEQRGWLLEIAPPRLLSKQEKQDMRAQEKETA